MDWHGNCIAVGMGKWIRGNQKGRAMLSKFQGQGLFKIPEALWLGHDEVRAELVRATAIPGPIGEAAMHVADICLPHMEHEEASVFPVFGLLRDLAVGEVRPEMAEVLPMISAFSARREALGDEHHSMAPAVHRLLLAAYKEDNREIIEFTYNLRMHERMEDQVIFPTVLLIRNYVQERLGL